MEDVENNTFFKKARGKAGSLFSNNERLAQLMHTTRTKLDGLELANLSKTRFVERIKVLVRLVKAYKNGSYREVQIQNVLLIVAALIYFVTPIDLIPDFIPITGLLDDFTVIVWVYNKVQEEIDRFLSWEKALKQS